MVATTMMQRLSRLAIPRRSHAVICSQAFSPWIERIGVRKNGRRPPSDELAKASVLLPDVLKSTYEIQHSSRTPVRFPHRNLLLPQQRRRCFFCLANDEQCSVPMHHEQDQIMGYSPEQLFDVAAGVDSYQEFVPWCQKSRVLRRVGDHLLEADLQVGFNLIVENYTSHIELKRPSLVKASVSNKSAIFEYLNSVWEINPGPTPGSCNLHFTVDFQFKSWLYSKVANLFLDEVVARMVNAFENRCCAVYGPPKVDALVSS